VDVLPRDLRALEQAAVDGFDLPEQLTLAATTPDPAAPVEN
jgi:hypothetical protein